MQTHKLTQTRSAHMPKSQNFVFFFPGFAVVVVFLCFEKSNIQLNYFFIIQKRILFYCACILIDLAALKADFDQIFFVPFRRSEPPKTP